LRDHLLPGFLKRIWLFCILLLNPQAPCQILLIFKKRRQNLILSNYSLLKLIEFANRITIHLRYKNVEVLKEGLKKIKKIVNILQNKSRGAILTPKSAISTPKFANLWEQTDTEYYTIQHNTKYRSEWHPHKMSEFAFFDSHSLSRELSKLLHTIRPCPHPTQDAGELMELIFY